MGTEPDVPDRKRTDPVVNEVPGRGPRVRFTVVYKGHRFELPEGGITIGRGTGCQLVLDDALVSRKHARIDVADGRAFVEDLGSVNGVFVNGERVNGQRTLIDADRVVIGQQEIQVFAATTPSLLPESPTARLSADTLVGFEAPALIAPGGTPRVEESEATRQGDALELLGGVADKVLALGRGDEAERILGTYLRNYLASVKRAGAATPSHAERAVGYSVKLAGATRRAEWVDYAFDLYAAIKKPLPAAAVDQLYTVLRQVPGINLGLLRAYLEVLRSVAARLGPAERFLVQRIEGLERLASA